MAGSRTVNGLTNGTLLTLVLTVVPAIVAFNAWWLMVLYGSIAGTFGMTTMGYGTSVLASLLLAFVGSFFRSGRRS